MSFAVLILAGGKSLRMGQDKTQLFGGIERLKQLAFHAGACEVVVLKSETEEESCADIWYDPPGSSGLHEAIIWALKQFDTPVCLLPSDAFIVDRATFKSWVVSAPLGGVPTDSNGRPQPLFSFIPMNWIAPQKAASMRELVASLPMIDTSDVKAFENFNTLADVLNGQRSLARLHGEDVLLQSMSILRGKDGVLPP